MQCRQRHAEGGQHGMPTFDGLARLQDVFSEPVESELLYLQQRLNGLQPPLFVLIQYGKTVTGDRNPQLRLCQQLRGAYRDEIFQRLLFVVARIGDEEGGLFAGGMRKYVVRAVVNTSAGNP
jgi:hypothetical protein